MPQRHDPDEGLWGRVLRAVMGMGLVALGLLLSVMMTIDEDARPNDFVSGLVMVGIGAVAVAGAVIGRAFGRWVLLALGLLLLAQATEIGLDLVSYGGVPSRFTVVVMASLVLLGIAAIVVAARQFVLHRRRALVLADG